MRSIGVLLVGSPVTDVGADRNERRSTGIVNGTLDCGGDAVEVEGPVLHTLHLPVIGAETSQHVLAEGKRCGAVKRDVIVVVEADQLSQPQMSCQRGRLGADPLHHVAVAAEHEGPVIHNLVAGLVVAIGQMAFRHRHPHPVPESLSQGSGGDLDTRGQAPLRMTRGARSPLAELLQFFERQVVAGQMQKGVEQHRPVTCRQNKAVSVRPRWIGRVMAQKAGPEHIGHGRCAHG